MPTFTLQQQTAPEQAMAGLEKAAHMMPNDSQAQYAYAKCLMDLGQNDEADPIFQRVIKMDALSEVAEMARTCRREMAQETMRDHAGGGLRTDAVFYCLTPSKTAKNDLDSTHRSGRYVTDGRELDQRC